MPRRKGPKLDRKFANRLKKIRTRIDMLPASHRPHLHELTDAIAVVHERLQNKKAGSHESA